MRTVAARAPRAAFLLLVAMLLSGCFGTSPTAFEKSESPELNKPESGSLPPDWWDIIDSEAAIPRSLRLKPWPSDPAQGDDKGKGSGSVASVGNPMEPPDPREKCVRMNTPTNAGTEAIKRAMMLCGYPFVTVHELAESATKRQVKGPVSPKSKSKVPVALPANGVLLPPPPVVGKKPEMKPSKVAWSSPDSVRMDQSVTVKVRIARESERFAGLEERVKSSAKGANVRAVKSEVVELATTLKATLVSTAFKVSPEGPSGPIEEIAGRDFEWSWIVEPLKPGRHALQLTITSVLKDRTWQESFTREITVVALPVPAASKPTASEQTADFLMKNWKELLSVVLIPLIGGLWTVWKKKRAAAAEVPLPPLTEPPLKA
jgi:hypothetical protein